MSEEVEDKRAEVLEERQAHLRAIAITSTASLAGVVAAIASSALTSGFDGSAAGAQEPQLVVLGLIAVQLPVYHLLFDEWGGAKDVLYVAFMTFIMWFVTWGIMLTSETSIV